MKGKKKPEKIKFEIREFIGTLKESDQHDWCKSVARIEWNGNPISLDIRNLNLSDHRAGKGISLTDEEVDKLITLLLENDYGSLELLEKAIAKKRNRFTIGQNNDVSDNKLIIEIKN